MLVTMFREDIDQTSSIANRFATDLVSNSRTLLLIDKENLVGTFSWQIREGLKDGIAEIIGLDC